MWVLDFRKLMLNLTEIEDVIEVLMEGIWDKSTTKTTTSSSSSTTSTTTKQKY